MAQRVDDLRVAVPALGAGGDLEAGERAVRFLLHVLLVGVVAGGGAGGVLKLRKDGVQTFQHRGKVQLFLQPRLERLQPCEDRAAAGDIRGRSAGIGVPLFTADGALVERMALGGHGAVRVIDHVDVLDDFPVVAFGGEDLLVGFAALGAGVGRMAALKTGGSRVNGLLPVVLAGGGGVGIGTGIILNHIIVGVGDVISCDRHVGITKLYRKLNVIVQSEEVRPGGVIV